MIKSVLKYLRDWKYTIAAAVLGGFMVVYGLPTIYQRITHSPVPTFYYTIAIPLFMYGLFMLPMIGLLWHVYKESTDPLAIAVRERVAREFMEGKQWEGLMDRLVKAEMQRILDYYFPPLKEPTRERVRRTVARVVKYVREYVQ